VTSTVRRVGAAGLALGLCLGAASTLPALADAPTPAPAVGGVLAGDDQLGDVFDGVAGDDGLLGGLSALGAVGDALADPKIGGDGSFGDPTVGGGLLGGVLGGVLGGLLSGGTGLLGGVL
jgi:hypothetical protein